MNQWIKKAVLLSFRLENNSVMTSDGTMQFYDKVPLKFAGMSDAQFQAGGYRAVPGAIARRGCFVDKNVVLMPSFVNIGAYVGEGTMVDTWATVVARSIRAGGARPGDMVHVSYGYGLFTGGLGAHYGAENWA